MFNTDRTDCYKAELAVLTVVEREHMDGLPLLVAHSTTSSASNAGEARPMLLTQPVASRLREYGHMFIVALMHDTA